MGYLEVFNLTIKKAFWPANLHTCHTKIHCVKMVDVQTKCPTGTLFGNTLCLHHTIANPASQKFQSHTRLNYYTVITHDYRCKKAQKLCCSQYILTHLAHPSSLLVAGKCIDRIALMQFLATRHCCSNGFLLNKHLHHKVHILLILAKYILFIHANFILPKSLKSMKKDT